MAHSRLVPAVRSRGLRTAVVFVASRSDPSHGRIWPRGMDEFGRKTVGGLWLGCNMNLGWTDGGLFRVMSNGTGGAHRGLWPICVLIPFSNHCVCAFV